MKLITAFEKALMKLQMLPTTFEHTTELCCMLEKIIDEHIIKDKDNNLYIKVLLAQPKNDFDKVIDVLQKKQRTAKRIIAHFEEVLNNQIMFYVGSLNKEAWGNPWAKKQEYYKHCLQEREGQGFFLEGKEIKAQAFINEYTDKALKRDIIEYIKFKISKQKQQIEILEFGKQYLAERINDLKTMQSSTIKQTLIVQPNTKQIEIQPNEMLHFTRSFTNGEKQKLFESLLKHNFLPQDTDYDHFCFVFGGTVQSEKPFEPLKWQRTIALLAYFIDNMFGDTDSKRLWEITSNCFMKGNDKPNKDSLKNSVSKTKTDFKIKPNGYETIDNIIF